MIHDECTAKERKKQKQRNRRCFHILSLVFLLSFVLAIQASAAGFTIDFDTLGTDGLGTFQLLFLFTFLALAPSLLLMMTCFTRIVIVFSFLRNAIGLQQTPPNQVIIGLSLFLSLFIMKPVVMEIQDNSIEPYLREEITQQVALDRMQSPIKEFMLKQTKADDLNLFISLAGEKDSLPEMQADKLENLGLDIVIPAFITSELTRAFTIGFLLFLPFLIIDMIVASTLMSMGMMMLPPSMISLPFKLMLFVVVDGWSLLIEMLAKSFY